MGRPTKIVVASMLSLTHGLLSLMYAMTAPLVHGAPWNQTKVYPMVVLLQLGIGLTIIVAAVLIVRGRGWLLHQSIFWLQVVNAVVCAAGAPPVSLGALPLMIPLPLTGMLLLNRPDSRWYLGVR